MHFRFCYILQLFGKVIVQIKIVNSQFSPTKTNCMKPIVCQVVKNLFRVLFITVFTRDRSVSIISHVDLHPIYQNYILHLMLVFKVVSFLQAFQPIFYASFSFVLHLAYFIFLRLIVKIVLMNSVHIMCIHIKQFS